MTEIVTILLLIMAITVILNRILTRTHTFEILAGGYMKALEDQNWQFISGENGRGDTRFV